MTTPWSVTPIKKSQRISGPKRMTSRGHRYVSPKPTPSAARSIPGPRMCNEAGASGSFLIGIGSSRPACHTLSSCACSVASPGAPPLVSTTTSFQPRSISARRDRNLLLKPPPQLPRQRCQPNKQGSPKLRPSSDSRTSCPSKWSPRNPEITPTQDILSTPILFTISSLPFPLSTGHTSIHRRAILCQAERPLTENHPPETSLALQPPAPDP